MQRNLLLTGLKACSSSGNLERGRILHKAATRTGDVSNLHIANMLINMYVKCASLKDAHSVFDSMEHRDVVSWTSLILGYVDNGESYVALDLFSLMRREGCTPDARAFVAALKACTTLSSTDGDVKVEWVKSLHLLALISGHNCNIFMQNILLDIYGKCGRMGDARQIFDNMKHRDVISWTAVITGYAELGESEVALDLFSRMRHEGCAADSRAFVAAIKACTNPEPSFANLSRGKALHIVVFGSDQMDMYVRNTLIDMYAKSGDMQGAQSVFNSMKHPDVVSWTALMSGYTENGEGETVLTLFSGGMDFPLDAGVLIVALKACIDIAVRVREEGNSDDVSNQRGQALHVLVLRHGFYADINVQNTLVAMYASLGSIEDAHVVFNNIRHPDVVSWSALLLGYVENGQVEQALKLFSMMGRECCAPNRITFVAAIKACIDLPEDVVNKAMKGKSLHLLASSSGQVDTYVENTLVEMYAKCRRLEDACLVVDGMNHSNVVSWTSLILGYAEYGKGEIALDLFSRMRHEGCVANARTFVSALKACTELAEKEKEMGYLVRPRCKAIHVLASCSGYDMNIYVQNSLVDLYAKCGSMVDSREVFDSLMNPDVVSWNSLMLGYVDNGEEIMVLDLFVAMQHKACEPNDITFVAVLKACGLQGALEAGRAVHTEINIRGLDIPVIYLVDFYAKCGSLFEAEKLFNLHNITDVVTWNALMAGHGRHGNITGVFDVLDRMQDAGVHPDYITFRCILTACNHAGLVCKGTEYLEAMSLKYGIHPDAKHYACVIDLLGRANMLDDALALLRNMPFSPNDVIWTTALDACRKWNTAELGKLAFESLTSLDGQNAGAYVLMANT